MSDVNVKIKVSALDYQSSEAYKTLRTNLLFCGQEKQAIVFTSCTPDEGKSTVVLRLAMSLAESDKRVLLVDGDLRKSVLLGQFAVDGEVKGLSHFLSRQDCLRDVICTTDQEMLDVIFAGPLAPNPAELLGSVRFKEMLKYARQQYDYILIDSAPLGSVIDSAIIAESCDASVIIVEAGCISYRYVQEIKVQLEKSGSPILGLILNKMDPRDQKYYSRKYGKYYGRYYSRYYGYGKNGKK